MLENSNFKIKIRETVMKYKAEITNWVEQLAIKCDTKQKIIFRHERILFVNTFRFPNFLHFHFAFSAEKCL
jgi:hypothetical protein